MSKHKLETIVVLVQNRIMGFLLINTTKNTSCFYIAQKQSTIRLLAPYYIVLCFNQQNARSLLNFLTCTKLIAYK